MARLIDLDELLKFPIRIDHYDKENGNKHFVYGIESVLEYAEYLPTVDAVEVVRCKDCQFAISYPFSEGCTKLVCSRTVNWRAVEQNHFCSYGERGAEDG